MTIKRTSSSHGGRDEVGTATSTLTALEVTVRGRGAALSRLELVGVHAETHRATSLTPVEAGLLEDDVETLSLGLALDETGAGDDHGVDALSDLGGATVLAGGDNDASGRAHVLNTTVRARAEEDLVDLDGLHRLASLEAHVLEGLLGVLALVGGHLGGNGDVAGDGDDVLGRGSPGDGGDDVLGLELDLNVILGTLVRLERAPVSLGLVPLLASGRERATLEVLEGDLVGGDHTGTGTGLDGHVTDGHTGLH